MLKFGSYNDLALLRKSKNMPKLTEDSTVHAVLFRGISRPHGWWRISVGDWWSDNPYYALPHYALPHLGARGEMYIATIRRDDLEQVAEITTSHTHENTYSIYHFNIFNRRFTSMRRVTEEELAKLNSDAFLEKRKNHANEIELARTIFPNECGN